MAPNQAMLQALARQKAAKKSNVPSETTPSPTTTVPYQPPTIRKGTTAELIFDPQITAVAQAKYPNSWKPFAIESPEADSYIKYVYGDKTINLLRDDAFTKNAPNFIKLKNTPLPINPVTGQIDPLKYTLSQSVFASLSNNVPVQLVKEWAAAQATSNPGSLGGLKLDEANKLIDDLYSEYDAANKAFATSKQNFLTKNDKYFNAGIPHPKFKYGPTTNYEMGTIDVRTLPNIDNWINQYKDYSKQKFPGSSAAAGIAVETAVKKAQKTGTPFADEAIRRQDLYKAAIVKK